MICRHMFRNSAVSPLPSIQTPMRSNAVMNVKDFDDRVGYSYIRLASDELVRDGGLFPFRQFIMGSR